MGGRQGHLPLKPNGLMNQQVLDVVYGAITELNEGFDDPAAQLPLAPDTALFGKSGRLDSLQLVNLIILTEQRVEDTFGRSIPLADERAMSLESSPFATVGTFADYVAARLDETPDA